MKNIPPIFLFILIPIMSFAQVGIGTTTPDDSSILDVFSNDKGILIPRVTSNNRDGISNPSNGLLLYNSTTKAINYFDNTWKDLSPSYKSINSTLAISTNSTTDVDIPGMELTPLGGTHSISFDSQISNASSGPAVIVNSDMLLADFFTLYNQLLAYPTTCATHLAAFGSGETILPGKYSVGSAISIAGTLTFDGQGNPDSVFIFHATGAANFGANTTLVLTNGASAENIFWVGEGAVGVGADSIVYGNLISHGAAVAVGASCTMTGRMITNSGAVSFGPGVCTVPPNASSLINVASLQTFVIFTGAGAINNTGSSVYNGNICSAAGTTGSLAVATINGILMPASTDTDISGNSTSSSFVATFSIYQNGIIIPSSSKQVTCQSGYTNISLHGISSILSGQSITIKWKVDSGTLTLGNRVFTSIKVQ
jgi:hypothetical protein